MKQLCTTHVYLDMQLSISTPKTLRKEVCCPLWCGIIDTKLFVCSHLLVEFLCVQFWKEEKVQTENVTVIN